MSDEGGTQCFPAFSLKVNIVSIVFKSCGTLMKNLMRVIESGRVRISTFPTWTGVTSSGCFRWRKQHMKSRGAHNLIWVIFFLSVIAWKEVFIQHMLHYTVYIFVRIFDVSPPTPIFLCPRSQKYSFIQYKYLDKI